MGFANLNGLRIFQTVFQTRSMTKAAQMLHLTQSGVSQHIKSLELELGFELFERVRKRLFPTPKAVAFFDQIQTSLDNIDRIITVLQARERIPEGTVRIGIPIEFGNNVVIPRLSELGKEFPKMNFKITLDFATVLSEMVLQGDLDFALIDRFRVNRRLKMEPVASEELWLCAHRNYAMQFGMPKVSAQFFAKMDYVDYKEDEPLVRSWFKHHLGRANLPIRSRAHIFDVQGVAKFVCSGLGAGVLPDHLASQLIATGEDLVVFEGRKLPLKNEMCMIYLPMKDRPLVHQIVMDQLRKL